MNHRLALTVISLASLGCSSSSGNVDASGGVTQLTGGTTGGVTSMGGSTAASFATTCMPGITQACLGAGRCEGAQACEADGFAWGPCDCGTGNGGASATGGRAGLGGGPATGGKISTGGVNSFVLPTSGGSVPTGGAFSAGGLSWLHTTQWTLTAPCTTGTLNCPCYSSNICELGLTCSANKVCVTGTTTGGAPSAGGASGIGGSPSAGGVAVTGGTRSTGGTFASGAAPTTGGTGNENPCAGLTPPTATGTLTVSAGYVTNGTLQGFGSTYIGDRSNTETCVTPRCTSSGCLPAFGASALCAAGIVAADGTYSSLAGLNLNLNQPQAGSPMGSIAAPTSVTVDVVFATGSEKALRLQVVTDTGDNYCVDLGKWFSGQAIPITAFSSRCWDTKDTAPLPADSKLSSIDLVVFSDSVQDTPFSFCLTGVAFD